MTTDTLLERITDYANIPDPYPLYAELRAAGVTQQTDGSYLVGTYHEIVALLHDPRISSDPRNLTTGYSDPSEFIDLDDPEHQRLRSRAMRQFGPPHCPGRIDAMRGEIRQIAEELIDAFGDRTRIDLVEDFAYPLPVTVICRLLGVAPEDEPVFRDWSTAIIDAVDLRPGEDPTERERIEL